MKALVDFSEGLFVVDITPLIQSAAVIAAALLVAPVLYVTLRLMRSSDSAYSAAHRRSGGLGTVLRGEVNPRVGNRLDPTVQCGITVEERRGPRNIRYAVLLPQGRLSRDTVIGLFR